MRRIDRAVRWAVGCALLLAASGPASAAVYHGKSVDGRRYQGSITNPDYGTLDNVEIRFHGEHAYVSLPRGTRLTLFLQDEEITDPRHIAADDPVRGVTWEINARDLGGR